jgi:hypothetical protein
MDGIFAVTIGALLIPIVVAQGTTELFPRYGIALRVIALVMATGFLLGGCASAGGADYAPAGILVAVALGSVGSVAIMSWSAHQSRLQHPDLHQRVESQRVRLDGLETEHAALRGEMRALNELLAANLRHLEAIEERQSRQDERLVTILEAVERRWVTTSPTPKRST